MIDCEKCMYRKNGGCGFDKNGCGFVPKTGDLISREEALMCLTGEYLEGQEYKLDDEIRKFIKRMQNVPTVPAIPITENATNGDVIKALFPNEDFKSILRDDF